MKHDLIVLLCLNQRAHGLSRSLLLVMVITSNGHQVIEETVLLLSRFQWTLCLPQIKSAGKVLGHYGIQNEIRALRMYICGIFEERGGFGMLGYDRESSCDFLVC